MTLSDPNLCAAQFRHSWPAPYEASPRDFRTCIPGAHGFRRLSRLRIV
jgi:hypothetical protein